MHPFRIVLRRTSLTLLCTGLMAAAASAQPVTLSLAPARDGTLYEDENGATANGSGPALVSGLTRAGGLRRALLAFDLSGIPAGSTVTGASLTLTLSRRPPVGGAVVAALHRVTANWGEGASIDEGPGGVGTLALAGDATWFYAFFETSPWATPGGDFLPLVSGSILVDEPATYTWSGSGMVTDAQAWVDQPASNFGWVLRCDELTMPSARLFESRESPDVGARPSLVVTFVPPPLPCAFDYNGDGTLDPDDLADFIACYFEFPPCPQADLNGDGAADPDDLADFIAGYFAGC